MYKALHLYSPYSSPSGSTRVSDYAERVDQISSQTMTWNRYNTLGLIDITHRHKYNLFLHNPALSCEVLYEIIHICTAVIDESEE